MKILFKIPTNIKKKLKLKPLKKQQKKQQQLSKKYILFSNKTDWSIGLGAHWTYIFVKIGLGCMVLITKKA